MENLDNLIIGEQKYISIWKDGIEIDRKSCNPEQDKADYFFIKSYEYYKKWGNDLHVITTDENFIPLNKVLPRCGLSSSNSDATRLIDQGAIYVNGSVEKDKNFPLEIGYSYLIGRPKKRQILMVKILSKGENDTNEVRYT